MGNEFTNKILKLALPITAQQFMLALVSACDAFMLGGLNQNSLSAVSLASQITFVFNLILTALTIGENMFVAQYYGKRDFDGLRTSAGLVLRYVFIISILFSACNILIPETLMRLFTNDTILIDYGIKYLKVIGLSYIFSGVLQVLQGILKNCGYAGRCTIISAVVVCVNIILNVILIYGYMGFPRMEIAGAAAFGYCHCKWTWSGYYDLYFAPEKGILDWSKRHKKQGSPYNEEILETCLSGTF